MLMEAKKELKVTILSCKYALEREMLNKVTFISNIIFMVLNNAAFIIQWIVLYSLKDNIGGYSFKQVLLLWGIAAGTYGFSHFIFKEAYNLSDIINQGKLDNYLLQPKSVLLSTITSGVEVSAIGDLIYSYIMLIIYGVNILNFFLYTLFIILGGLIIVSIAVIFGSLSFWFGRVEIVANTINSIMTNFATYPGGIFKGVIKILFYTILPVGIANYLPVEVISHFNTTNFLIIVLFTIFIVLLANIVFNKGLKKYSSSNLMNVRV